MWGAIAGFALWLLRLIVKPAPGPSVDEKLGVVEQKLAQEKADNESLAAASRGPAVVDLDRVRDPDPDSRD